MVDEFIKRKHGEVPVTYPAAAAGGDPQGHLRRHRLPESRSWASAGWWATTPWAGRISCAGPWGKKDPKAMAEQRARFVAGATENSIPKAKANEIFDLMERFAEYGFNKSHSAAYALISYYTAYLKTHHPVEFMAALLTSELANQDKVLKYVNACRDMDIEVLPPDVNVSRREFTVSKGRILFGLGSIKNVGDEAIREIIEEREGAGRALHKPAQPLRAGQPAQGHPSGAGASHQGRLPGLPGMQQGQPVGGPGSGRGPGAEKNQGSGQRPGVPVQPGSRRAPDVSRHRFRMRGAERSRMVRGDQAALREGSSRPVPVQPSPAPLPG